MSLRHVQSSFGELHEGLNGTGFLSLAITQDVFGFDRWSKQGWS